MNVFVANNLGVLSYNGNDWKVHNFKNDKKKRSLAFDENNNRLYVGSQGEFGFFEENWKYTSIVDIIPKDSKDFDDVWDIFFLDSKVYFCTFKGIYIYDNETITVIRNQEGLNRSFYVDKKIFTQNQQGRLFEIKGDKLTNTYPQKQTGQIISGILAKDGGHLLFYNSGQIEFNAAFSATESYEDLIKTLQGKYVNHVLQLSDTRIAISTQTSGLFLYDFQTKSIENLTTQDGLQTNACLRSFQDFSGNLWIGMQNGIALIDINSPIQFINGKANVQGSGYETFETDIGTYFTTSNGIYFLPKNANQSVFLKGTEGPAYGMQKIAGKLYAGHHTGLFLLENGNAKRLVNTEGLWQVKQLRSNPDFVIGGAYDGLYLFKLNENKVLEGVQKINGFNESSRFFEEDNQGRIWVGQFYKGLYQLQLTENLTEVSVKKISDDYDLPIDEQIILSRIDNEIYIATKAGLYKLDQKTDRIVDADLFSKYIGKKTVYLITQDLQKNIHLFAENLVGSFKQISSNNYSFVPSSLFQFRYSFNNDLLNISINVNSGIYYNANKGFIHYQPELENYPALKKPLVVGRVFSVAEDSILFVRRPFEVEPENKEKIIKVNSYQAKVLQFYIESFQFNVNSQQFRYFLEGFDEKYGEWTTVTTKEYTNLNEGEYTFIVQTRNYFGETVSSHPLVLKVAPPIYRSLLAKILYVIFGLLSLFMAFRFQRNRYRKKEKKIVEVKKQLLLEKQQKLIEIEQQKEQELTKLKQEKMFDELNHVKSLLAASTMNLVVKNEFIEGIKENLKQVKRKGKSNETKQALEQIVREIDTTLRLQEDWKQFKHHFDQVHSDFSIRLAKEFRDLTPNDQKLCAFLRLNLSTKEIASLMGISIRGVEIARYRLRKKIGLEKGQNLSKFILEY
ncbi:MAG: hypothetical protein R3E32_02270 [Chitinophagales bacterium]